MGMNNALCAVPDASLLVRHRQGRRLEQEWFRGKGFNFN